MLLRRVVVVAVWLAASSFAVPAAADPAPPLERLLVDLANEERARAGIGPLETRTDLTVGAAEWTVEMVERRVFLHDPDLGERVCCYAKLGENIGYRAVRSGLAPVEAVRSIHEAWLRSPEHLAVMLDPAFSEVGVAVEVVTDPGGGRWYVTSAVFREPAPDATPPDHPRSPRGAVCGMPADGGFARTIVEELRRDLPRCGTTDGTPVPPSPRRIDEFCADATATDYVDVGPRNVHRRAIDCLTHLGVADGRSDGSFAVAQSLRRGQLIALLARALRSAGVELPPASDVPDRFSDDDASVHEDDIDVLAHIGVVDTEDDLVAPDRPATRAEMAALAEATLRAGGVEGLERYDYFADDVGWRHETAINRFAFVGGASGTGDGAYRPAAPLRRDAAASYVARVLTLLHDAATERAGSR